MKYKQINIKNYKLIVLDLDGTITKRDTLVSFSLFFLKKYPIKLSIFILLCGLTKYKIISNLKFKKYYAQYILKGSKLKYTLRQLDIWFSYHGTRLIKDYFVVDEFIEHPSKIIVSSNFDFIVKKYCNYLNIQDVIATKTEIRNKIFTGKIIGKVPFGKEKLNLLLKKYDIELLKKHSIAFGNDEADFEILSTVAKGINVEKEILI